MNRGCNPSPVLCQYSVRFDSFILQKKSLSLVTSTLPQYCYGGRVASYKGSPQFFRLNRVDAVDSDGRQRSLGL
jgi:hypothetical protein